MELQKVMTSPLNVLRNVSSDGLVKTRDRVLVAAYIAHQLGFNEPGRFFLERSFFPRLRKKGIHPLDPFKASGDLLSSMPHPEREGISLEGSRSDWGGFNGGVGKMNYEFLMPRSKLLIAILDGGHAVDDGVAPEVSHYWTKYERPVIGIRSDIRGGENLAAPVNPALRYFFDQAEKKFKGPMFFTDYNSALDRIEQFRHRGLRVIK